MSGSGRDPLLPRPVVIVIAILVAMVWAFSAVATFIIPGQSGTFLAITSMMGLVLGAALGITDNPFRRPQQPKEKEKDSGSDTP